MIDTLNGYHYKNLIYSGLMNLKLHCNEINDLNVFPVPDGDTGTNMVNTLQNGYNSIKDVDGELSELAQIFAKAVTFGARGNSGVIVSQFFYGFTKCFFGRAEADCSDFVEAVEIGTKYAYKSVSNPVEGTILTVLREASEYITAKSKFDNYSIDDIVGLFLKKARISLNNTPNLLPVLKAAGVYDSGGAGIVYFFEGVKKYIDGEPIAVADSDYSKADSEYIDYSCFNRESKFEDGYCTEFLLQTLDVFESVDKDSFLSGLEELGSSVVAVFEDDKIKVHVHTQTPEKVMAFAHKYGEFLSLKIENMSVQNYLKNKDEQKSGITIHKSERISFFSVIAVTADENMKDIFMSMGADVVIHSEGNIQPAVTDYLEAFEASGASDIFVFPNSKNSTLAAIKAKDLYGKNVTVFGTKSDAECYSALSMIDFDETDANIIRNRIDDVIKNIYSVKVLQAVRNSKYNDIEISAGDFLGVCGDEVLSCCTDFAECCTDIIKKVTEYKDCNTLTLFMGDCDADSADTIKDSIKKTTYVLDVDTVETMSKNFSMLILFE